MHFSCVGAGGYRAGVRPELPALRGSWLCAGLGGRVGVGEELRPPGVTRLELSRTPHPRETLLGERKGSDPNFSRLTWVTKQRVAFMALLFPA